MNSIGLSAFLTTVSGVVASVLGYELFNKYKIHPFGKKDAALFIGGMAASAICTPVLIQAARKGFERREIPLTKWNFKVTGLGVTQAFGYSAVVFRLFRPYLHRVNPAFSLGYIMVQLGANVYTLYKALNSDKQIEEGNGK